MSSLIIFKVLLWIITQQLETRLILNSLQVIFPFRIQCRVRYNEQNLVFRSRFSEVITRCTLKWVRPIETYLPYLNSSVWPGIFYVYVITSLTL